MDFKTKLSGNNVSLFRFSERNYDYESDCTFHWEFYTELREWGVKDIGIYGISFIGEFEITYWNENDTEEKETIKINSDDDGWVLDLYFDEYELGHSICPQDVDVDFLDKTITINF